jgi:hypothetical protein
MPTVAILETTIISRNPSVVTSEADGELLMMNIEQSRYFTLNALGRDIWQRIQAECSFSALVDALALDYFASRATISDDVAQFINKMAADNVIYLRQQ